ncbi:MAG: epoxyqueuosine reductase QueH [Anaerolineae bacterium]
MKQGLVVDRDGQVISPCSYEKAQSLIASGQADLVDDNPFTIRLNYTVKRTLNRPRPEPTRFDGQRLLLHICCGPCATFSVQHLRSLGWEIIGFWYNPNIQPALEYTRRVQALTSFAEQIDLPMIWDTDRSDNVFQSAVKGHERAAERCTICYRLRLWRTAQVAAERGIETISTSLLISPYQDQAILRQIGDEVAAEYNLQFYYENLRRGYNERTRLSRLYGLYLQKYCGCLYSAQKVENRRNQRAISVA